MMDARAVKDALYARHPGSGGQMPGPWTCIEEWRGIDLLAFSAWSSASRYARVGYEVKVSRSDLRRELLDPAKRARNVAWCNEFYFAVPKGLLTADEIAFEEPDWPAEAFLRERCPNAVYRQRGKCKEVVPVPVVGHVWQHGFWNADGGWRRIECRTCGGRGYLEKSQVEREAPTLWVPKDVGVVVVDGRGCRVVKPSPRRKECPTLGAAELGQLVRWVSMRPDPRHQARRNQRNVTEMVALYKAHGGDAAAVLSPREGKAS